MKQWRHLCLFFSHYVAILSLSLSPPLRPLSVSFIFIPVHRTKRNDYNLGRDSSSPSPAEKHGKPVQSIQATSGLEKAPSV